MINTLTSGLYFISNLINTNIYSMQIQKQHFQLARCMQNGLKCY